jgi:hypothetical protein
MFTKIFLPLDLILIGFVVNVSINVNITWNIRNKVYTTFLVNANVWSFCYSASFQQEQSSHYQGFSSLHVVNSSQLGVHSHSWPVGSGHEADLSPASDAEPYIHSTLVSAILCLIKHRDKFIFTMLRICHTAEISAGCFL